MQQAFKEKWILDSLKIHIFECLKIVQSLANCVVMDGF